MSSRKEFQRAPTAIERWAVAGSSVQSQRCQPHFARSSSHLQARTRSRSRPCCRDPRGAALRFRKHVKTPSPLWVWALCKNSLSLGPQRDAPRPDVHIGVLQDGRSGGVRETFLEHEKLHDLVSNAPNFDLEEDATPELEVHRPRQLDFRSLCTAQ